MLIPRKKRGVFAKRLEPECVVLQPDASAEPSDRPPVRLFVGSEPAQYRAERAFFWSIEKHRDPGRTYEIYLMKELDGFDDRRWLTGFTNYRFAIPTFAGGTGRAIYNDIDQVYLDDPGKLFDLDLQGRGYLAVSERDTSVMLLDCEKMTAHWSLARARRWRKNRLIDDALKNPENFGTLGGEWNARDQDHVEGWSKCVHFTTIHKQPWHPFPDRFVYQPNPAAGLFAELEQEANRAGFNVFTRAQPSARYRPLDQRTQSPAAALLGNVEIGKTLKDLATRSSAHRLFSLGGTDAGQDNALAHTACEIGSGPIETLLDHPSEPFDGIIATISAHDYPTDDVPWIIDALVGAARSFVLLVVDARDTRYFPARHRGTVYQAAWWESMLSAAAARREQVHWTLAIVDPDRETSAVTYRQGGAFLGKDLPTVWLLEDHKPGHTTQSQGLVEALGWPYQRIKLEFNALASRPNFLRGPTLRGLSPACAASLTGPWPDLVVASGARTAPVAEWIRKQSRGRTRTVHLGRKGSHLGNEFDLSVAPAYVGLYPDPRRIETTLPITRVRADALEAAASRWCSVVERSPSPRIALLVGGDDSVYALNVEQARRMGGEVATLARDLGGSVMVTTSRRTHPDAARALVAALGNVTAHSYHWSEAHHEDENPYLGYLALADVLIVSGESASMLAEATATGKPVYIYPLERRGKDTQSVKFRVGQSVSSWIMDRAFASPTNRRGWERPQAGLELICAQIAARGWVRPHGDITKLHEALIERGNAKYFNGEITELSNEPLDEAQWVAARVRELVGVGADDAQVSRSLGKN